MESSDGGLLSIMMRLLVMISLLTVISSGAPSGYTTQLPQPTSGVRRSSANSDRSSGEADSTSSHPDPTSEAPSSPAAITNSSYFTVSPGHLDSSDSSFCPYKDWHRFNGHCYWSSPCTARWGDVRELCHVAAAGARPVSVHSEEEDSFIRSLAWQDTWIGLLRHEDSSNWTWADGSPLDYQNWSPDIGEPAEELGEQCVSISAEDGRDSLWTGRRCEERLYFICQMEEVQNARAVPDRAPMWQGWGQTTAAPWTWGPTGGPWVTRRGSYGPTTRQPLGLTVGGWGTAKQHRWTTTERWGRTGGPWGRTEEPWGRTSGPWGRTGEPWGRTSGPWGRTSGPWGRTSGPWGTNSDRWGTTGTPLGTSSDPWGATSTPLGTSSDPWGTTSYPWGTTSYPWGATRQYPRTTNNPWEDWNAATENPTTDRPWRRTTESTDSELQTTDYELRTTDSWGPTRESQWRRASDYPWNPATTERPWMQTTSHPWHPTAGHSRHPTTGPSRHPTVGPSRHPTAGHSWHPTAGPSRHPTVGPYRHPTAGHSWPATTGHHRPPTTAHPRYSITSYPQQPTELYFRGVRFTTERPDTACRAGVPLPAGPWVLPTGRP